MSIFFDWPTAILAGKAGHLVRRKEWTDRWLRYYNGLWWLRIGTATPTVVKASDFGREEFLSSDWTNLPPECVTAAQAASGQTCPNPFDPTDPGDGGTDGGNSGNGGSGSGGSGLSLIHISEPTRPY